MSFNTGHAVVIGVNSYSTAPQLNVAQTKADAEAVAEVLRDPQYCGYPSAQVTLLVDGQATRDAILGTLDQLAGRIAETDTLLLFYAGHGMYDTEGGYCLTTGDIQLTRVDGKSRIVAGTAVGEAELLSRLRQIKAQRMLMIFNACHSGEISPATLAGAEAATETGQSLPEQTTAALLGTGSGRVVITACRPTQFSFVGGGERTIFAQTLVDILHGQGLSGARPYISVFEFYETLYAQVGKAVAQQIPEDTRQRYGGTQEPELTVIKGVGPFAVGLYHGATALGEVEYSPPPVGPAVRSLTAEESQRALQQILTVQQGVAAGSINNSEVAGRDKFSVHGGPGTIGQASGPVTFNSGSEYTYNINGDYAGRDMDKRQGTFYEGNFAESAMGAAAAERPTLATLLDRVQETSERARRQDANKLADELESVGLKLNQAVRAQNQGDMAWQREKLQQARVELEGLAQREPMARELAQLAEQVA